MSVRPIVQAASSALGPSGDSAVLITPSALVTTSSAEFEQLVADLLDTMQAQQLCVGLAANQIGSSLSVAAVSFPGTDEAPLILVNPVVAELSGKKDKKRESCMSVWGFTGEVERRTKVRVDFLDRNLHPQSRLFEGFVARIVLHEIEHLSGILYTDHVADGGVQPTGLFEGSSPFT